MLIGGVDLRCDIVVRIDFYVTFVGVMIQLAFLRFCSWCCRLLQSLGD